MDVSARDPQQPGQVLWVSSRHIELPLKLVGLLAGFEGAIRLATEGLELRAPKTTAKNDWRVSVQPHNFMVLKMTKCKRPEDKLPRGQPTKYRREYCDLVKKEMAAGYSLGGFAGLIGVNRDTIDEWRHAHPEFSEAVKEAKTARLRKWEAAAIKSACTTGGGSPTMIIFGLKNCGSDDWHDRSELRHTGSGHRGEIEVKDGSAREFIMRELARLAARAKSGGDFVRLIDRQSRVAARHVTPGTSLRWLPQMGWRPRPLPPLAARQSLDFKSRGTGEHRTPSVSADGKHPSISSRANEDATNARCRWTTCGRFHANSDVPHRRYTLYTAKTSLLNPRKVLQFREFNALKVATYGKRTAKALPKAPFSRGVRRVAARNLETLPIQRSPSVRTERTKRTFVQVVPCIRERT